MQIAEQVKADAAQDVLQSAVEHMTELGADFADAKSQTVRSIGIQSINGNPKTLSRRGIGGVCLRAWCGGRWGYGNVSSFDRKAVTEAAEAAVRNAKGDSVSDVVLEPKAVKARVGADVKIHPDSVDLSEKMSAVLDIDAALKIDDRIANRIGVYSEEIKTNCLVNSAGSDISWEEVRTLLR